MAANYSWLQQMTTNNQYFKHDDHFLRVQEVKCQHGKGKRVKVHTSQRPKRPEFIPVSLACLRVLLFSPRRDASPSETKWSKVPCVVKYFVDYFQSIPCLHLTFHSFLEFLYSQVCRSRLIRCIDLFLNSIFFLSSFLTRVIY